jgi:hypothetical protein
VLKAAGAIPVYRRLDQGVDASRNTETFAAVDRALAEGEAICIFPEGISHSTGRLEPLRTGAARMALSAERQGVHVQLVAVGLNFERKTAFRSRVTVLFGRPFSSGARGGDEQTDVRTLTARMADEMRRLLIEADPAEDAATVQRVERLYSAARGQPRSAEDRVERRRAIAAGIDRLRLRDPARFIELAARLRRYDRRLRRFGLRDSHLDWDLSARAAAVFAIREGLAALILLPAALAGLAIFWLPYRITGLLARRATRQRDVAATATAFVGAAVYSAWLAVLAAFVWKTAGTTAGMLAVAVIPMVAVAGLFAIEREAAAFETARAWLLLRRAHQLSRERLKRARADFADLLDQVYEWLSAEKPGPAASRTPS